MCDIDIANLRNKLSCEANTLVGKRSGFTLEEFEMAGY